MGSGLREEWKKNLLPRNAVGSHGYSRMARGMLFFFERFLAILTPSFLNNGLTRPFRSSQSLQVSWDGVGQILLHCLHLDDNLADLPGKAGFLRAVTNTFSDWCLVVKSHISCFVS